MKMRSSVCCVLLILTMTTQALAEPSSATLVVKNCRVALAKRAALAGSRMGILQDIDVAEGDLVQQGQVVAALRDDQAQQALAIARKEMSNTVDVRLYTKISELATLEYSKAVELNRSVPGGFSELDLKKLRLAAEKSVLQIEQADFQQQMATLRKNEAEVVLDSYRITAPFAGVVLQVHKQLGEAISSGEVVVEIANFDTMRVEGFIPVDSSDKVRSGAPVTVEVSGLDPQRTMRFEGRIKFVSPVVNEVSQEVRIWAEVQNRNHLLKDGLPATMKVNLIAAKSDDVASDEFRRRPERD